MDVPSGPGDESVPHLDIQGLHCGCCSHSKHITIDFTKAASGPGGGPLSPFDGDIPPRVPTPPLPPPGDQSPPPPDLFGTSPPGGGPGCSFLHTGSPRGCFHDEYDTQTLYGSCPPVLATPSSFLVANTLSYRDPADLEIESLSAGPDSSIRSPNLKGVYECDPDRICCETDEYEFHPIRKVSSR